MSEKLNASFIVCFIFNICCFWTFYVGNYYLFIWKCRLEYDVNSVVHEYDNSIIIITILV